MITFEQGKRIVDTLHRFGVDWDDICDLWDSEVYHTANENRGRAPEVIHRIDYYAGECRALEVLENAADELASATWYDGNPDNGHIGIYTTAGLPEGASLEINGKPGDEDISLRFKDKFGDTETFMWSGEGISKVEKYLPNGWRHTYAILYEYWQLDYCPDHIPGGSIPYGVIKFITEEQQA